MKAIHKEMDWNHCCVHTNSAQAT